MQPTLLVLAAGMGSRYGGLKQIDPMGPNGETILDYSLYDAIQAGYGKVVFVIREEFEEAFRTSIGARFADRIEVDYAFQRLDDIPSGFEVPAERTKPWGTAHAVYAAREVVTTPCAVINADDFYGRDAYVQSANYLRSSNPKKDEYCIVGYYLENTLSEHGGVNRGITSHQDGFLATVEEVVEIRKNAEGVINGTAQDGTQRGLTGDAIVSMNFWGFTPQFFERLESHFRAFLEDRSDLTTGECYIPTVVDDLIASEVATCRVLASTGSWFGVTYPDDKPVVVETIANLVAGGEYPSPLLG